MANKNLQTAKALKNDEFYTQYFDIQKEVSAYLEYNPNIFRDKTILLPCDDPEWSNFTKFFAQNFQRLGIKKLISTSFAPNSKTFKNNYQPSLFEINDPNFDAEKTKIKGKLFTLTQDTGGDGIIDIKDLEWKYLQGDGDFRSDEIKRIRDESDIIITNPPFSLFREFLSWIIESNKQFLIIGNLNAITYKEVFPLLKSNKVWLGNNYKVNGGAMFFEVPKDIANMDQVKEVMTNEKGEEVYITRVPNVRWFTNIDHGRLHEKLILMTEADVIRYSRMKPFEIYDNYDAIDVSLIKEIPSDFNGVMGVPVSFLDKYNPDQFELLGSNRGVDQDPNGIYGKGSYINGKETYKRIFIRHKKI